MSIQPHYRTISELLKNRTFAIDEYQREYKWEQRHIEELISDLVNRFQSSYRSGDSTRAASGYADYFLGSIIVTQREGRSFLVDGQQRVTSLTLLLIFLYREAKSRGMNVADTVADLVYSDSYGERVFNLDIPERTPVLKALFTGEPYATTTNDESISTVLARYEDIEANDFEEELADGLESFIYWVINRVGVIEIVAGNDAQAYAIFETMNDRGKPLSPVDMLKAYLLAPLAEGAERSNANRVWRRVTLDLNSWGDEPDPERDAVMMKAWLRSQYAASVRERKAGSVDRDWETIGTTFHRWIRDAPERLRLGTSERNVEMMTRELPFYASAYVQILDASRRYTPGLEHVFYNAHNEFTWQPTVLLAPLEQHDDPETTRRKMAATAAYLDIWLMRRVVNYVRVGYSTTSYAMFRLARDIRRLPLERLVDTLESRLETEDDVSFRGSPSRGRNGVLDLALNQFSRRYVYHLLARVTAWVEAQSTGAERFAEYVDRTRPNPLDIEHVWADDHSRFVADFEHASDFGAARNRIGGLLLLPADVNRSLQAKPYDEKVVQYASQNFFAASLSPQPYEHQPRFRRLTNDGLPFRPIEGFGPAEQAERAELVLALAERIWHPDSIRRAAGLSL